MNEIISHFHETINQAPKESIRSTLIGFAIETLPETAACAGNQLGDSGA